MKFKSRVAITSVQCPGPLFSLSLPRPSQVFLSFKSFFLLREIKERICITWVNCILNITNAYSLLLHVSYRQNTFLFSQECGRNLVRYVKLCNRFVMLRWRVCWPTDSAMIECLFTFSKHGDCPHRVNRVNVQELRSDRVSFSNKLRSSPIEWIHVVTKVFEFSFKCIRNYVFS